MKATFYRLGEYKIIEDDNGALRWEAHAGIGAVVGGRCFVRGEMLFIGTGEREEPGFLANEFLNQLRRFPQWERTKFYSLNYEICYCKSGRRLTEGEIAAWSRSQIQWTEGAGLSRIPLGKVDQEQESSSTKDVSYRLGRYEIIHKPSGQLWYKTPSGHAGLRVGKSIIAGDILFIGSVETEEPGYSRSQFLERLAQLPEWEMTSYYSLSYALYDCGTGKSFSEGQAGGAPGTDSLLKGDKPLTKIGNLQQSVGVVFSKLRKGLRAVHTRAETRATPTKDSLGVQREPPEKGSKNGGSRETKAGKLDLHGLCARIQWRRGKKWIGYIAGFFLIIGFLLMAVLGGHWKKEDGHHKRGSHPASHHNDH